MPQRNITLTPELDSWIDREMQTGFYSNTSEFVRAALRHFKRIKDQESLEDERLALIHQRALDDYEAGRTFKIGSEEELDQFFADIRAEVDGEKQESVQ